jgi:hypothetical protein
MIVMIRHILVIDSRTVLRTMFSAGVLAGAGAKWVGDDAGGAEYT